MWPVVRKVEAVAIKFIIMLYFISRVFILFYLISICNMSYLTIIKSFDAKTMTKIWNILFINY